LTTAPHNPFFSWNNYRSIIDIKQDAIVLSTFYESRVTENTDSTALRTHRKPFWGETLSLDETKPPVREELLQTDLLWHQFPSMPADDSCDFSLYADVLILLAVPEFHRKRTTQP